MPGTDRNEDNNVSKKRSGMGGGGRALQWRIQDLKKKEKKKGGGGR